MSRSTEMVLFYTPETTARTSRLKGIFVRLGIRIRNITPEQMGETIGYLAGMDGFEPTEEKGEYPAPEEEILVMKNFTSRRIDELILAIRKAGLSKIEMKAVVTPTNAQWTFYKLYEEIREERKQVLEQTQKSREEREAAQENQREE